MELLQRVINTIKKYSMLTEGNGVLIGLSGGPDSVCLTIILDKLRDNFNLSLSAIYINHGLRQEENKREESFCRTLCDRLNMKFYTESVNVKEYARLKGLNIQEAGRELRYRVFKRYSEEIKAKRIALGHNADDQAETMIMRLLRGAGRKGLSGIPPVRGNIIRPFIEIQRGEIENFLTQQKPPVEFLIDSSNLRTDYLRNWIRLKIVPELKKQNPAFIETINRSSVILNEEDAYLDTIVTKTMMRLVSRKDEESIELFLFPLERLEMPILRRVLIKAISGVIPFKGIDFVHIEELIKLIRGGKSGNMFILPKGLRAVKKYSTFLLTTKNRTEIQPHSFHIPGKLYLEEINALIKTEVSSAMDKTADGKKKAVFDLNTLTLPLCVRKKREGDYFYPADMNNKKKKLQDFFVDEKIPREERDSIPIMVSGDDVVWIAGYRMDERFKAGEKTKRFLIAEYIKLGNAFK